MVHHIVVFELANPQPDQAGFVKNHLMSLSSLPYCHTLVVTDDIQKSDLGGHLVLFAQYKDAEALARYMADPLHREVIAKTTPYIKRKTIVDFGGAAPRLGN